MSQASRLAMLAARYEESLTYGRRALELAERLDLPEIRAHTLASVGSARNATGDLDGLADLEESAALARQLNSPELARSLHNLAVGLYTAGRMREAEEVGRASIAASARFGLGLIGRFTRANDAHDLYRKGRWDEVLTVVEALLEEAERLGLHGVERQLLLTRSLVRLGRGDIAGADADTDRMLELARRAGEPNAVLPARTIRIRFLIESGRLQEVRDLAEEQLATLATVALAFPAGTDAAFVARCVGAETWLDAITKSSTWRTPWLEAIEELLCGDPDRAVERYAALATPVDEAFARMEAAKAHLGAGRRAEAEAHLEAALAFYRKAGASRYVAEAETLLAASAA